MEEDVKYLKNGQAVIVIAQVESGFVVDYLMEDIETGAEFCADSPRVVDKVFDRPPIEKYIEQVAELKNQVDTLRSEKREMEEQIAQIKKSEEPRLRKYKQHEQLALLDAFLDKGITHYVEIEYSEPTIVEFGKALCQSDNKELKLLSLFGNSKGDLRWRINDYKDGSGLWRTVIPCTSYEMAVSEVQKSITECANTTARIPSGRVITAAEEYGVELPKEYIERWEALELSKWDKSIEEYSKKLEHCKQERASLERRRNKP